MAQGEDNFIEYPLGKIGTDQPTLLPTLKIPFPKNTNPVNIEIKTDTDTQTIATATTQTLKWHDSLTIEQATATALLVGTTVASITIINGGIDFTVGTNIQITGGGGSGASAEVSSVSFGTITGITITNAGSGYTSTPTAEAAAGTGKNEVLEVVLTDTTVDTITVTNGGKGYASVPAVTVSDPENPGSTATATAVLTADVVTSITVDTAGAGYASTPTVSIAAPTGIEESIIESAGTTLCMILFDGITNLTTGDIEIYATVAEDTVDIVTDELLYVSHGALNTGEFLWPVTPIWLPLNKFLTITNAGASTITVNRVLTINYPKYP